MKKFRRVRLPFLGYTSLDFQKRPFVFSKEHTCNMVQLNDLSSISFFIVKNMHLDHVFSRKAQTLAPTNMRLTSLPKIARFLAGAILALCALVTVQGGTATKVNGLSYTGVNPLPNGTDSHWTVSYSTEGNAYQGAAYVINTPASGWTSNVGSAEWITAPGNSGSAYLPGNGTTGANVASYVYKLAFTIVGKPGDASGSAVTNQVSITLTMAADDQAKVYVNPTTLGTNGTGAIDTANSKLGGSLSSAWTNTTPLVLQNFNDGTHADNASFVIGTNYLYIQVDNTNGVVGDSGSNANNLTGLLVYQTSSSATVISTNPVPEVGVWLPVVGALGLFFWRRSRTARPHSVTS